MSENSNPTFSASLPLIDAALGYASMDWPVFPLLPHSKVPPKGSHGVKDATIDADLVEKWWRQEPQANIGLAAGAWFWVLDVDFKGIDPPEPDGVDSLAALKADYGPLPATVTNLTGGGGWQYLLQPDPRVVCATAVLPGIDVKSTGGYIVAPFSTHPVTGNRYRWRRGFGPGEIEIAMAPEWLVALVEPVELPEPPRKPETIKAVHLDRYAEAALASACENIARASPGAQEITLGREAFGIGRLVAAKVIPRGAAKARLIAAGERMSSDPKRRKWTREQITRRVERSIAAAASSPRTPEPVH